MKFEWDIDKANSNKKKHGVTFEEAQTVFTDPLALIFDDEWHSKNESREIITVIQTRIACFWFTSQNEVV
jgi:uncharacterized protein